MPRTLAAIGELKAHLSEYLTRVRAGEEVVITDRGRPVARLVPLGTGGALDARAAELVRTGLAKEPAEALTDDFFTVRRPPDPTGRSLEAVLEERAEGW
jgi:prevent-host-death family protein